MAVWIVRAGRYGEREEYAISNNVVVIGWDELPDISNINSREEMAAICQETYPDEKPKTLNNWAAQLWAFKGRIQNGDIIVLPLKTRSQIALGKVTGNYEYSESNVSGCKHFRRVDWIYTDLPRSTFDQDLLYSFGAFLTVCQIQRNNAEERIKEIISGKLVKKVSPQNVDETEGVTDLSEYARDQIRDYIGRKFRGHDLERLVNEILKAQGYSTYQSPPGSDGGVDIIAGRGSMGFEPPRLCVQVKSSDSPVDVTVLRELQGILKNFGAQQGLLVSWGGFKTSVISEARRLFFEIRLWDADNIVSALTENYDNLSDEIQAEIPLKQTWVLVLEE